MLKQRKKPLFTEELRISDPELFLAIKSENKRQEQEIELIASENITSLAVMQAQGSVMTNKYAEGYPGRRYYGGCEFVDVAETLAIERVKKELSFRQKEISDFSDNELEALIAEEEKEVMKTHKFGSMQALLILLGINII